MTTTARRRAAFSHALLSKSSPCILALCLAAGVVAPASAETPVDQCTDSGSASMVASPSGTGFQPEPNLAMRPSVGTGLNLGTVDPRTGAFTYSNEDMALGAGEFPARLALVRNYNSDRDGPNGVGVEPNAPYSPGSIQWYAFGRGGTHNLDVRFREEQQAFGSERYTAVVIRTGFQTETFQRCLDGQYRNTKRNGARLLSDSTYSPGGYRYEMSDGTVLLFQKMTSASGSYTCERTSAGSRVCGVLRRLTKPNGDWAEFEYQTYYSHPSNRAEGSWSSGTLTNWTYNATTTQCYPNFGGQNECHGVIYPNYYTTSSQSYPAILSYPVYEQRLTRVFNSRGYELRFNYADSTTDVGGTCSSSSGATLNCTSAKNVGLPRNRLTSVTGHLVSSTGQATQLAQVSYGYANCLDWAADCLSSVQGADGAITQITRSFNSLSIQLPGEAAPATTVTFATAPLYYYYADRPRGYYNSNPRLTREYFRVSNQAFADGSSVQYVPTFADRWVAEPYGTWARLPFVSGMQITEPGNAVTALSYVDQNDEHSGPVSVTDPLNRTTTRAYNAVGALTSTTYPEGDRVAYDYDIRGNVLSISRHPKPGSLGAVLVESLAYSGGPSVDANSCPNQKLCNRPVSRTDPRGNQTDFAWDGTTGLPSSETRPADVNGQRPTTTFTYGTFPGLNSSMITVLTSKTEKIDASRNVQTGYDYTQNTLLPRSVLQDVGGLNLRTCFTYDARGNKISETSPRAGLSTCN